MSECSNASLPCTTIQGKRQTKAVSLPVPRKSGDPEMASDESLRSLLHAVSITLLSAPEAQALLATCSPRAQLPPVAPDPST